MLNREGAEPFTQIPFCGFCAFLRLNSAVGMWDDGRKRAQREREEILNSELWILNGEREDRERRERRREEGWGEEILDVG